MSGLIFAYITFENRDEAENIAVQLIDEGLAACVNIFPEITSVYKWEGKVTRAVETIAFVKTEESRFKAVEEKVRELHSYETPCIVSLAIKDCNTDYLGWVKEQLQAKGQ